jgi:hypothetical protein
MSGGAAATCEGEERPTTPTRTEDDEEYDIEAECSNVSGLNTDAGIEMSGARKTLTKRYVAY